MNETGEDIRNSELWSHDLAGWETPEVVGEHSGEIGKMHLRPFDLAKLPCVRKQGEEAGAGVQKEVTTHAVRHEWPDPWREGAPPSREKLTICNILQAVATLLPSVVIAKSRLNTRNYCPQRFVNPFL